MAATGFTPIQLYRTTTASAQPSAGNLADGELAINLTDKKLYAKDASNNVFVLADASSGGTTATNLAGGAAGSVPYQTGANATTFLGIGTAAQVLQVNSGATAPEWVNTSGTGDVARTTSPSFTTPSLGAATALSINSLTLTTSTGTFTLANGKTLTVNNSLTLNGTDATTMTFPSTSATIARTDAAQSFTGTQTFLSNPVLDAGTANGVLYLEWQQGGDERECHSWRQRSVRRPWRRCCVYQHCGGCECAGGQYYRQQQYCFRQPSPSTKHCGC
jgi:hypothetical protein